MPAVTVLAVGPELTIEVTVRKSWVLCATPALAPLIVSVTAVLAHQDPRVPVMVQVMPLSLPFEAMMTRRGASSTPTPAVTLEPLSVRGPAAPRD